MKRYIPRPIRRALIYSFAFCGLMAIGRSVVEAVADDAPLVKFDCQDETATLNVLRERGTVVGAVFTTDEGLQGMLVAQGRSTAILVMTPGYACVFPMIGLKPLAEPQPLPGAPL